MSGISKKWNLRLFSLLVFCAFFLGACLGNRMDGNRETFETENATIDFFGSSTSSEDMTAMSQSSEGKGSETFIETATSKDSTAFQTQMSSDIEGDEREDKIGASSMDAENDKVEYIRVSILLEAPSVTEAGYSLSEITSNSDAQAYQMKLKEIQAEIIHLIEEHTGEPMDVKWQITLSANVISANIRSLDKEWISQLPGVVSVMEETLTEPNHTGTQNPAFETKTQNTAQ